MREIINLKRKKRNTNGVPKSLARMRAYLFFSDEGRNVCFSLKECLFSNPFPPIQC